MMDSEAYYDLIQSLSQPLQPIETGMEPKLQLNGPVKAVLFDVYGTLLISGSGDVGTAAGNLPGESLTHAIGAAGLTVNRDLEENGPGLLRSIIEGSHAASKKKGIEFPEVDMDGVWSDFLIAGKARGWWKKTNKVDVPELAIHYECLANPVWPMPSAWVSVEKIQQQGLRLGIVSNAQFYTPIIFEVLIGESLESLGFEAERCSWSYRLGEAKPSMNMFRDPLAALAQAGIPPSEVVYVGNDMLKDIWTAKQCGCQTVLFAGDQRSLRLREDDERCKGLLPDAIVTHLDQLPELLSS
jgi:putative hydrolase of the HAD superfamily